MFSNRWIVVGGMGVIAVGTIAGTVLAAFLGDPNATGNVSSQRIFETATPEDPEGTSTATSTATATATATAVRRYSAPPEMTIDPEKQYIATLKTEKGDIRLELYAKDAPQTVNNFVFLARNDFYDGLTFHRVIENFVAQGGDPTGTGTDGPGYYLPSERNDRKNEAGTIAMARSSLGISGSQFFINYTPQPSLDAQGFTVFGKVTSGMDVLQSLTKRDPQRNPRAAPGDRIVDVVIEER